MESKYCLYLKQEIFYFLALKPLQNATSNVSLKSAKKYHRASAINFLTDVINQLQVLDDLNWTSKLLKILFELLTDVTENDCEWIKPILGFVIRILAISPKYHINQLEINCLYNCLNKLKSISWDVSFCTIVLDFAVKKLFLGRKKICPNWISFAAISMEKVHCEVPAVLSAKIETIKDRINHHISRNIRFSAEGNSKKKKIRRLNDWLKIHIFLLKGCSSIKWSFLSKKKLLWFFGKKFSINTRLRFWMALVRMLPNEKTLEFSTSLVTSMLADPKFSLRDCSKKLVGKFSDKYLKIVLKIPY